MESIVSVLPISASLGESSGITTGAQPAHLPHMHDQRRSLPLHKARAGQAPLQLFPVERKAPKFPGSVNCPCVYTICPVAQEHDNASDAQTGSWCSGDSRVLGSGEEGVGDGMLECQISVALLWRTPKWI